MGTRAFGRPRAAAPSRFASPPASRIASIPEDDERGATVKYSRTRPTGTVWRCQALDSPSGRPGPLIAQSDRRRTLRGGAEARGEALGIRADLGADRQVLRQAALRTGG